MAVAVVAAAGCGNAESDDRTIRADLARIEIGPYRVDEDSTLSGAIAKFGKPDLCRVTPESRYAAATWSELGLTIFARSFGRIAGRTPCEAPREVFVSSVRITGRSWKTDAGLRVGDSDERTGEIYRYARRGPGLRGWWLVVGMTSGSSFRATPLLVATTRGGTIRSFVILPRAEGL